MGRGSVGDNDYYTKERGRASEIAEKGLELAGSSSEPAGKGLEPAGRGCRLTGLRAGW